MKCCISNTTFTAYRQAASIFCIFLAGCTNNRGIDTPFQTYDVLIAGAGAAGLFCAFQAARRGRRVVVLEHNTQPGRKILISGGGRCNFTNRDTRADCFLSENAHFAKSALARYSPADFVALVERHGIAWHEKTLGQLFCDGSARQIVDLLLAECREAGVETPLRSSRGRNRPGGGRNSTFSLPPGHYGAGSSVLPPGGPSIPKIGATGFAYEVARHFGLNVVPPRPGAGPADIWRAGDLRALGRACRRGDCRACQPSGARSFAERLLFTHRGLSGPAILQISSYWQPGQPLHIDLAPGIDLAPALLTAKRTNGPFPAPATALAPHLPDRLAAAWATTTGRCSMFPTPRCANSATGSTGGPSLRPGRRDLKKPKSAGGVATAELSSRDTGGAPRPGPVLYRRRRGRHRMAGRLQLPMGLGVRLCGRANGVKIAILTPICDSSFCLLASLACPCAPRIVSRCAFT